MVQTTESIDHSNALAVEIAAIEEGHNALLAWSCQHPELRLLRSGGGWVVISPDDMTHADVVRAVMAGAPVGTIDKKIAPPGAPESVFVERQFGGGVELTYVASRREVCTAVVIGTEEVQVPDPDAPMVTVTRDVVEWKCEPMLAKAGAA